MRLATRSAVTLACFALLWVPASALAKTKTHAPPGNSGVEEYLEVVPGGGGNRPAPKPKGPGHAPRPLSSSKAQKQLRSYGKDGRATANLARLTADPNTTSRSKRSSKSPQGSEGKGTFRYAAHDENGDGGMLRALKRVGIGFPALLLLLIVAAGGFLLRPRRRGRPSES